jgi:hypothetical protein
MKKALLTLAALAMAASAYAQGTITYWNSGIDNATGGGTYDAPIFDVDGTTRLSGAAYTVGLYSNGTLVPGSQQTFLTGAGAGFFNPVFDLVIPGSAPGSTPTLEVRAWQTSAGSFAAAQGGAGTYGSFSYTSPALGGVNPAPPPPSFFPPTMTGLQSFSLVPEPSTYALGMLGLGALAMMRRRK